MYKIIGGDGQEYGPVTEADLCKWIAEGRLNGQSLVKAESDTEFRALSTFPEFAGALGEAAAAYGAPPPSRQAVDWKSRDYELDIGSCISRGWNLFTNNLGIIWGSSALLLVLLVIVIVLFSVISGAIGNTFSIEARVSPAFLIIQSCVGNIVMSLVIGPLLGGLYYVFLQTIRGQPPGVSALFIGFQRAFLQLFLGNCVIALVIGACFLPVTIFMMPKLAPVLEISQQAHGAMTPEQG
jgi:GYF domain 2